jgi:hypothetical protein
MSLKQIGEPRGSRRAHFWLTTLGARTRRSPTHIRARLRMAAGVADHIWALTEIAALLD